MYCNPIVSKQNMLKHPGSNFFHLSPVSSIPMINLSLRISLQIFVKIQICLLGILRGPGGNCFMKKTWSWKSRARLPLKVYKFGLRIHWEGGKGSRNTAVQKYSLIIWHRLRSRLSCCHRQDKANSFIHTNTSIHTHTHNTVTSQLTLQCAKGRTNQVSCFSSLWSCQMCPIYILCFKFMFC